MEVKVKFKSDKSPWITKVIAKSLKKKQRLYEKFLNKRALKNEEAHKLIKTYLKPLKGDQRKNFTQKNCKSLKVMRKKTWSVMKQILESAPPNPQLFHLKLLSTKLTFLI